jgi:hypothetical protein
LVGQQHRRPGPEQGPAVDGATKFSSAGLLTDDAMGFIGSLVQTLRRRKYQPRTESAAASTETDDASAD